MHLYPSLLAANPSSLHETVTVLNGVVPGYHLDSMDPNFTPMQGLSVDTINAIAQWSNHPLWIHLMADDPATHLDRFIVPVGTRVTIPVEISGNISSLIKAITARNWKPGLALKPGTSLEKAFPHLAHLDHVLLMGVEPGLSGQPFMPDVLKKIGPLQGAIASEKYTCSLAFDGGVNPATISLLDKEGIAFAAVGSALFTRPDLPKEQLLKNWNVLNNNGKE